MEDHNGAKQRKIGIVLTYANIAVMLLITVIYTPIMLNRLGASEYGIYTMAVALTGYLAMLDLGLSSTLVKFSSKYHAQGETEMEARLRGVFLVIYTLLGLVSLVGGLLICGQMNLIFGGGLTAQEIVRLRSVFLIMTINLAISFPLKTFSSVVTACQRFVVARGLELLKTLLSYGAMILLLLLGGKAIALSLISAVFSIAASLVLLFYVILRLRVDIKLGKLEKGAIGEIIYYSFFVFLNIIIDQLYQNTSRVILCALCGTLAVATYNIGMQFHSLLTRLSVAVSGVYLPHITALVTQGGQKQEALSRQFISVGRFQFIILSFFMSGFICFGRSFIHLWAGLEYEDAYPIALIVMIPAMIPLTQNLGILILQAKNKHAFRSIVYLGLAILNVAVGIPLVRLWEGIGAAIAMALSCFLGQILIMNIYYAKVTGLNISGYWREIKKITVVTAAICLVGIGLRQIISMEGWLVLIILVVVYSAFYLCVAWLGILNKEERAQFSGWVKRLGKWG